MRKPSKSPSAIAARKTAKAEAKRKTADDKARAKTVALAVLEADGLIVKSLAEKINRQELAAANAYIKEASEADTFKAELGKKLLEVQPKCKAAGMTFEQFKEKYVGDLYARTKIFELMKVARGAITLDQIRELESAKKREQREAATAKKVRDNADVPNTNNTVRVAGGETIDLSTLGPKTVKQLEAAGEPVSVCRTKNSRPLASGEVTCGCPLNTCKEAGVEETNDNDNDTPAKSGDHDAPTINKWKDTHEKISARALAAGKSWLDENLATMTVADRAGLFHYFKFHPEMVGVKRAAA